MIKLQQLKNDILPITAFRTQLASILKRLEERKTPVVLTHNGRATAVLLSVEAYEEMASDLEAAKQVISGLTELAKGEHPAYEGVKPREAAKQEKEPRRQKAAGL